ncbi:MAG TPA: hypothetical protein VFK39_16085 [Gemmatimonadaceae bacterium]|nr:hypothetical protein [Gemmatimonadaceae bacterium]
MPRSALVLLFLAVCVAIAVATPCIAQGLEIYPDSAARIRVLHIGDQLPQDARLVSLRRDTLIYQLGECCATDTAALSSLAAIDVSQGVDVDPGRVLGGMTWGLLAGLGAGWLVTEIGCRLPESSELCGLGAARWMPILGGVGLITGAWWGIESKEERWERIYPPARASLFVSPVPNHGVAVGVALSVELR